MSNRTETDARTDEKDSESGREQVRACPDCDSASGLREHTDRGSELARAPAAYARTDYTCKRCGAYVNEADVVERPPEATNQAGKGSILAREDITTIEEAREASRDGGASS